MRSVVTSFGIVCTDAAACRGRKALSVEQRLFSSSQPVAPAGVVYRIPGSRPGRFERMTNAHSGAERGIRTARRRVVQASPRARDERRRPPSSNAWRAIPSGVPTALYDRPAVILLTRYVRVPQSRRVPVTRRGVLRRDGHRCGYCGKAASTIDHVLPRSRGGADSWENLVACCLRCNNVKGDRTPQEMQWELRYHAAAAARRAVDGARHRARRPAVGAVPRARRVAPSVAEPVEATSRTIRSLSLSKRPDRPRSVDLAPSLCSSMEEQFRPKERVGGSSPSRGTACDVILTRLLSREIRPTAAVFSHFRRGNHHRSAGVAGVGTGSMVSSAQPLAWLTIELL